MSNSKFILSQLQRELIKAYRRDFKDDSAYINWSDALCKSFSEYIGETIKDLFSEEAVYHNHHSVSETTVQRIVNGVLTIKDNLHWTTRRVLDNICIYLGYANWNEFESEGGRLGAYVGNRKAKITDKMSDEQTALLKLYMQIVQEAKQVEFDAYKDLSMVDTELLKDYYDENGLEYERILKFIDCMKCMEFEMGSKFRNDPSFFFINKGMLIENEGTYVLFLSVFTLQQWYGTVTQALEFYYSLLTFQTIHFTKDKKIDTIIYGAFCDRDNQIVDEVYSNRGFLTHFDLRRDPF